MQEEDHKDILNRPIITISSSEEEAPTNKQVEKSVQSNRVVFTKWQNEQPNQKLTLQKIASITSLMEEQERMEQEDRQGKPNIAQLKKERERKRREQLQLKKEFSSYGHLSTDSLRRVKSLIDSYDPPNNIFLGLSDGLKEEVKRERLKRIKQLVRGTILLIESLRKEEVSKLSSIEQSLIEFSEQEAIEYCQKVAVEIEGVLFKKLFEKSKGKLYHKQLQIVMQELKDKNNVEFHRKVLSRDESNIRMLPSCSQNQLKCAKTRNQQTERLRQLVRESEKISQERQVIREADEGEVVDAQRSQSAIDEEMRVRAIRRSNDKSLLIGKNKQILKATWNVLRKVKSQMRERREKIEILLKQNGAQ